MRRAVPLLLAATLAATLTACADRPPEPVERPPQPVGSEARARANATSGCEAPRRGSVAGGELACAGSSTDPRAAAPGETVAVAGASATRFRGSIHWIGAETRARMRYSWRPGCPVGLSRLRLLKVDHWGFDGRVHRGELVVHRDHARRILAVMARLFREGYPIQRLRLVDAYRGDDDRSMAANNTSAFNCRRVAGTRRWSEHAYGRAIDVNPLRNPWVTRSGRVSPPAGRRYANRAVRAAGIIRAGDKVVRAFAAVGWGWGGYWSGSRDYQHFSSTGR
jgi:D-alanyl-D-alanine carboxypeptidase-like protein